jgi:hypothetical protein
MQGRVKDVCAVVERHTAATHAISSEHAAAGWRSLPGVRLATSRTILAVN